MSVDPVATPASGTPARAAGLLPSARVLAALFVGWWSAFGLLFALRDRVWAQWLGAPPQGWGETLGGGMLQAAILGVVTAAALWVARRFPLDHSGWARNLALHLGVGVLVIGAISLLTHLVIGMLFSAHEPRTPLLLSVMAGLPGSSLIYVLTLGVGYGVQYFRRYQERLLRASQLEAQLADAQLQALNMQLHPHFLFNTLNSISALMHRDVRAADRMLARLEDLLRLTLAKSGTQEVPLRDELELLEPYLEIEQTRFGPRLTVEWALDPLTLPLTVPQLILQPIVENAIKHGISPRSAAGHIRIASRRIGATLELEVADNGPGLNTAKNGSGAGGVGLRNTRSRLERLYGHRHRFSIESMSGGGTRVRIGIPIRFTEPAPPPDERAERAGAGRRKRVPGFAARRPSPNASGVPVPTQGVSATGSPQLPGHP
jgi:two-component system, LytTR family, sensor kinase